MCVVLASPRDGRSACVIPLRAKCEKSEGGIRFGWELAWFYYFLSTVTVQRGFLNKSVLGKIVIGRVVAQVPRMVGVPAPRTPACRAG